MTSVAEEFIKGFKVLKISFDDKVMIVELNRPKKMNALDRNLFTEIRTLFEGVKYKILKEKDIRCIVLKGAGGNFSAGLDLNSDIITSASEGDSDCIGRKGFWFIQQLEDLQACMSSIENNPLPVICAFEGYTLGGATSIITSADMRFCTKDSKISIREIEIGLTADIGVLQRMFKQVGNNSLFRQYCFTGEIFDGDKALEIGFVTKVFSNSKEMMDHVMLLAKTIAEKSPVVLWGIKQTLNFARENNLNSSLEMIKYLNSSLFQSDDIKTAVLATLKKEKKIYAKF